MSVISRLVSPDKDAGEQKLPVHQFTAALAEFKRGAITGAEFVAMFTLDAAEVTQVQNWLTSINGSGKTADQIRTELEDVLELGEFGLYTLAKCQTRVNEI